MPPAHEPHGGLLPDGNDPHLAACTARYWRANVRLMAVLLAIWAVCGLGCGVLLADVLNTLHVGGFPVGFWFAQQGSIVCFVLLVLAYAACMARLDARHQAELARLRADAGASDA